MIRWILLFCNICILLCAVCLIACCRCGLIPVTSSSASLGVTFCHACISLLIPYSFFVLCCIYLQADRDLAGIRKQAADLVEHSALGDLYTHITTAEVRFNNSSYSSSSFHGPLAFQCVSYTPAYKGVRLGTLAYASDSATVARIAVGNRYRVIAAILPLWNATTGGFRSFGVLEFCTLKGAHLPALCSNIHWLRGLGFMEHFVVSFPIMSVHYERISGGVNSWTLDPFRCGVYVFLFLFSVLSP